MHKLCLYTLVVAFTLVVSDGQDGSSNRQIMFGNGFMSHTSSDGTVHSMGSGPSGSFMTNTNSNGNVQSIGSGDLDSLFTLNGGLSASWPDKLEVAIDGLHFPEIQIPSFQVDIPTFDSSRGHIKFTDGTVIQLPGADTIQSQIKLPSLPQLPQLPSLPSLSSLSSFRQQAFADNAPPAMQTPPKFPVSSNNMVVVSGGNGANGADASQGGADGADGSIQVQALGNGSPIVTNVGRRRRRNV